MVGVLVELNFRCPDFQTSYLAGWHGCYKVHVSMPLTVSHKARRVSWVQLLYWMKSYRRPNPRQFYSWAAVFEVPQKHQIHCVFRPIDIPTKEKCWCLSDFSSGLYTAHTCDEQWEDPTHLPVSHPVKSAAPSLAPIPWAKEKFHETETLS